MTYDPWIDPAHDINVAYIQELLDTHPKDCIFEDNAAQKITDRLKAAGITHQKHIWGDIDFEIQLEKFRNCVIASEIYCPHEGIDRRSEYGIVTA